MADVDVRPLEPGDCEAVGALLDAPDRRLEWFSLETPFDAAPAGVVAEHAGSAVAALPATRLPLRVGGDAVTALVEAAPVVAPGYRGDGLPARMRARLDELAGDDPDLAVAVHAASETPGDAAAETSADAAAPRRQPGRATGGDPGPPGDDPDPPPDGPDPPGDGRPVAPARLRLPSFVRLQDSAAVARAVTDGGAPAALGRLAAPAVDGYLSLRDRLAGRGTADAEFDVRRHEGAPPAVLASLAAARPPRAAHAYRCERFYRWRFAEPGVDVGTYVAHGSWGPPAALVVDRRGGDPSVATVAEVAPLDAGYRRPGVVAALLDAALEDAADADAVTAAAAGVPPDLLRQRGFRPVGSAPLAGGRSPGLPAALRARPLGDDRRSAGGTDPGEGPASDRGTADRPETWTVNGVALSRPANWRLAACERTMGTRGPVAPE